MTEKQKDKLAGLTERLDALVRRNPKLADMDVETIHTVSEIVSTLVLWMDHGKVPEKLLTAIARKIDGIARKWARGLARCRQCRSVVAPSDVLDNQGTCRRCGRRRIAHALGPHHDSRPEDWEKREPMDWLTK